MGGYPEKGWGIEPYGIHTNKITNRVLVLHQLLSQKDYQELIIGSRIFLELALKLLLCNVSLGKLV